MRSTLQPSYKDTIPLRTWRKVSNHRATSGCTVVAAKNFSRRTYSLADQKLSLLCQRHCAAEFRNSRHHRGTTSPISAHFITPPGTVPFLPHLHDFCIPSHPRTPSVAKFYSNSFSILALEYAQIAQLSR